MMDISFDVDVNLEQEQNANKSTKDDCNFHLDYDNQKLFNIYESYLAKADISDTESEPDMSFNYDLNDIDNRLKTPLNTRVNRRISCFADIQNKDYEYRKSISVESTPNASEESIEEMNELSIPWNLSEMSEKEIIDLINKLEDDLIDKEVNFPAMAASNMKIKFDKQLQFFDEMNAQIQTKRHQISEHVNCDEKTAYDELLAKELKDIKLKSEHLTKLMFQLKLTKELLNK